MNRRPLTKAEDRWQRQVRELGCIVCLLWEHVHSDCDIHHITGKKDPDSEFKVLGLCPSHHRSGLNTPLVVSVHNWKRAFEARYETEEWLLNETRRQLEGE